MNSLLVPEEFNFDPVTKSYGSPERRPEIKSATIEFIAPSEYMVNLQFTLLLFRLHSLLFSLATDLSNFIPTFAFDFEAKTI